MHKIFISYSRLDKDIVLPFCAKVETSFGIKCWIDLHNIAHAEDFTDKIINAINDCEVFLFMASVNSMNSNFVKRELSYAISQNKRIVPIIIDKSELSNWHKFNLGHINCMDFQDEQDMDKLMAELYSWLKIDSIQNIISKYKISFPIKELCTKEAIQDLLLEFDSNPHNLITVDSSDIKNFLGRCEKVKYTIINLDMIDDNNGVSIIKRVLSEHVKQYSNIILNLIGCVDKIKIGEIQDFLSIFAPESNIIWGVRDSHIRNEIILILGR